MKSKFDLNLNIIESELIGYGRALKIALQRIKKNTLIVICDADGTYPINKLHEYIKLIDHDQFFISINRFKKLKSKSMSKIRFVGNKLLTKLINITFDLNLKDSQSGMWIFDSEVIDLIDFMSFGNGMSFSHEIKIISNLHPEIFYRELDGEYYPRNKNSSSNFHLLKDGLVLFYNVFSLKFSLKSILNKQRQ